MTLGTLFALVAAILFFLAAVGATFIPNMVGWGLFFLALALVAGGIPLPWSKS